MAAAIPGSHTAGWPVQYPLEGMLTTRYGIILITIHTRQQSNFRSGNTVADF